MPGLLRLVLIACFAYFIVEPALAQETGKQVKGADWSKYGKFESTNLKNGEGEPLYALKDGEQLITYVSTQKGKTLAGYVGAIVSVYGRTIVSATGDPSYVLASHVAIGHRPGAQDSWVGKAVFMTCDGIKMSHIDEKGKVVREESVVDFEQPISVLDDKNGWLLIENNFGTTGWVKKSDAIRLEDAAAFFSDRIGRDAKDADALIRRANALAVKADYAAAFRDFDLALRLNPNDVRVYRSRAEVWRAKENHYRMMSDLNNLVRLNPKDAFSFSLRGDCWLHLKEFDKAITDCTQALQLDPKSTHALATRMGAWGGKGEQAKLKADAEEILRIDPANKYRHGLLLMIGDNDRTLAALDEAIRNDPGNPSNYLNRGAAWMQQKDYDKAIADLSEGIRISPQYAPLYINRASAWLEKKDYDKAIADCSEALRVDPTFPGIYTARGTAYFQNKNYERAIQDFEQAEKLAGPLDHSEALAAHAILLSSSADAKFRDGKKAVQLAKQAVKAAEDSRMSEFLAVSGHIALAAAHAECGDFAEAVRWQERAMQAPHLRDDPDMRARLELYRNRKPYRQP